MAKHIAPKIACSVASKLLETQSTDNLDLAEDSDVQSRLACITQENHASKAQLSQLMELVQQLLPNAAQVVT